MNIDYLEDLPNGKLINWSINIMGKSMYLDGVIFDNELNELSKYDTILFDIDKYFKYMKENCTKEEYFDFINRFEHLVNGIIMYYKTEYKYKNNIYKLDFRVASKGHEGKASLITVTTMKV